MMRIKQEIVGFQMKDRGVQIFEKVPKNIVLL
jgi:hypothetical protein